MASFYVLILFYSTLILGGRNSLLYLIAFFLVKTQYQGRGCLSSKNNRPFNKPYVELFCFFVGKKIITLLFEVTINHKNVILRTFVRKILFLFQSGFWNNLSIIFRCRPVGITHDVGNWFWIQIRNMQNGCRLAFLYL